MSKNKNMGQTDLLNGPIMKSILLFALPIFVSLLFQQLYNAVDTAIVGNVLGEKSLAAMGSVSSVFDLIIHFATGLCSGFGIVIARSFGSKDEDRLKRSVAGALMAGLLSVIAVTIISFFGLKPLLRLINTPEEILPEALSYITIVAGFLFVTFIYNFASGALRAIGNSFLPLIFLLLSSVVNVILDYVFVAIFKMGIAGAAYATVISQSISAVLCIFYIVKKVKILVPEAKHFKVEAELLKELAGQGYAMVLMSSIVSLSSVILQSGINGLGTEIIAAHVASRKLFSLSALPFISVPFAVSTFIAQNRGANQGDRILKAMKASYIFFAIAGVFITAILWTAAPFLVKLISGSENPVIINNGSKLLYVLGPFLAVLGVINSTRSSLQGIGRKLVPVISSIIELCGKILFVSLFIPRFGYDAVIWCEPLIWLFMAMQLVITWRTNKYIKGLSA